MKMTENDELRDTHSSSPSITSSSSSSWQKREGKGRARFEFVAKGKYQISLEAGDLVSVQEFSSGWFKGVQMRTGQRGIFPAAFIELFDGQQPGNSDSDPKDDDLCLEVDKVLREWSRELTTADHPTQYEALQDKIAILADWRRLITNSSLPKDVALLLRASVVNVLESNLQSSNHKLIVPRNRDGQVVTTLNTPLIEVFTLHKNVQLSMDREYQLPSRLSDLHRLKDENPQSAQIINLLRRLQRIEEGKDLDASAVISNESHSSNASQIISQGGAIQEKLDLKLHSQFYDLRVSVRNVEISTSQTLCFYFSLYNSHTYEQLSEDFLVQLEADSGLHGSRQSRFIRIPRELLTTSFTIVCKIVRQGPLQTSGSSSTHSKNKLVSPIPTELGRQHTDAFRRPYAVAVWGGPCFLNTLASEKQEALESKCNYIWFANSREDFLETKLRELLRQLNSMDVQRSGVGQSNSNNSHVSSGLITLRLQLEQHEPAILHDPQSVLMIQMDPLVSPLSVRNDVYVRLCHGVFQQDRKRSARNIEVRVHVVYNDDATIAPAMIGRQRAALGSTYRSTIYYHENSPHFEEQLLVRLPALETPKAIHLLFIFSHVSTTAGKSHPFSYSFLPLYTKSGGILPNGEVQLKCYKPLPGMGPADTKLPDTRYLMLQPILAKGTTPTAEPNMRPKEHFIVEIKVCSSEEPQNPNLAAFLKLCQDSWLGRKRVSMEALLNFAIHEMDINEALQHMRGFLDGVFRTMDVMEDDSIVQSAFMVLVSFLSRAAAALGPTDFRRRFELYVTQHFVEQKFTPRVYIALLGNLRLWIETSPLLQTETSTQQAGDSTPQLPTESGDEISNDIDQRDTTLGSLRQRAMSMDSQESGSVLRCLAYLCRLISISRRCAEKQEKLSGSKMTTFQQHFLDIFYLLDDMAAAKITTQMSLEYQRLVHGIQRDAMIGMAQVMEFGLVDTVVDTDTMSEIARGFLDSLHQVSANLRLDKLTFLQSLCSSQLLMGQWEIRSKLIASVIRALQTHLRGTLEEQEACSHCIVAMLTILQRRDPMLTAIQRREDVWNAALLLPEIFHAARGFVAVQYREAEALQFFNLGRQRRDNQVHKHNGKMKPLVSSSASKQLDHFQQPPKKYASFLLDHLPPEILALGMRLITSAFSLVLDLDAQQLKFFMSSALGDTGNEITTISAEEFMRDALVCCNAILHRSSHEFLECYPDTWFLMHIASIKSVLTILEWFSARLTALCKDGAARADLNRTNSSLWLLFLHASFSLAVSPVLRFDTFDVQKKQIIEREHLLGSHSRLVKLLRAVWDGALIGQRWLIGHHLGFDILQVCTSSVSEELVVLGRKMYLDMLIEEFKHGGNITEVVTTVFVDYVSRTPNSEVSQRTVDLFNVALLETASRDLQQNSFVTSFVEDMAHLCKLLRELDRLPHSSVFESDRVDAIVELLNYLRRQGRHEQFLGHLEELIDMHEELGNSAEAANARLLQLQIPGQDRESVLWSVVDICARGRMWERGITVLDELRDMFERNYMVQQIPRVLNRQAEFFTKLVSELGQRFYPNYYRVVFVAPSHPSSTPLERHAVWNRSFVYKGNDMESLVDFCARLELSFAGVPVRSDRNRHAAATDRWIEVQAVKPCSWFEKALLEDARYPESMRSAVHQEQDPGRFALPPARILKHQAYMSVSSVTYLTSFRQRAERSGNEILDTWAQKNIAFLDAPGFPCLSRRLCVTREEKLQVDPLRLAVQTIQDKNCEILEQLTNHGHRTGRDAPQSFTMLLSGVIDAAVSGGVMKNYDPFFTGEYCKTYPEILAAFESEAVAELWINYLRELVQDQTKLLEDAIEVHGQVCAEAVLPLHEFLCGRMNELKALVGSMLTK